MWGLERAPATLQPRRGFLEALPTLVYRYQVIALYALAAHSKSGEDWRDGYAVHKTVMLDMFRQHNWPTDVLRDNPWICYHLTHFSWWMEALGGFMLSGPPVVAMLGFLGLNGMQMGFFITMGLALFPITSIVATIPFLPGELWDWLGGRLAALRLPPVSALPHPGGPGPAARALLAMVIAVPVVAWNLHQVKAIGPIPGPVRYTGLTLGLAQHWDMFSPKVTNHDYWVVAPGRLRDNTTVNAMWALGLHPGTDFSLTARMDFSNETFYTPFAVHKQTRDWNLTLHWAVLRNSLAKDKMYPQYPRGLAGFLCRSWNTEGVPAAHRLVSFKLVSVREECFEADCDGYPCCEERIVSKPHVFWYHKCFKELQTVRDGPLPPLLSNTNASHLFIGPVTVKMAELLNATANLPAAPRAAKYLAARNNSPHATSREVIKALDADGSGELEFAELEPQLTVHGLEAPGVFAAVDLDGSGGVSQVELAAGLMQNSGPKLDAMAVAVAAADANGDGELSDAELRDLLVGAE